MIGVILLGFTFYQSKEQEKLALVQEQQEFYTHTRLYKNGSQYSVKQENTIDIGDVQNIASIYQNFGFTFYL